MTPRVYLAGPVQHADNAGATWRSHVEDVFGGRFDFLNPLAKYDVPAGDVVIVSDEDGPAGSGEVTVSELVEADKRMICDSDAVFVGWSAVPSCGTPMEVYLASQENIPVAVWYDGDPPISPWMEYHADYIDRQLAPCLEWILTEADQ